MHTELRTVSAKTALDGRLEIGAPADDVARVLEAGFTLEVDGVQGPGTLVAMRCACARARTGGEHEHHFVEGEVLRALTAGREVVVELRPDERRVVVRRP